MAHLWDKIRHSGDKTYVFAVLGGASFVLGFLAFVYLFFPLKSVFSDTPAFSMFPKTALNQTTPRFQSSFFYGTVVDPTGTISHNLIINDSLIMTNVDSTRTVSVSLAGKIQAQEGWFAFSENPVVLLPGQTKQIDFIINIPSGVCSKLWEAYIIGALSDYTGMPTSTGMGVSSSTAIEVFFNIAGTTACVGGEVLPGLGVLPTYTPLPTFQGTVPVMTSGGGGTVTPPTPTESLCENGLDDDGDGLIDCADPDCASRSYCQILPEICNDGLDNDKNGLIDCADPVCFGNSYCTTTEQVCDDLIDNDSDGFVDCADSDCAGNPVCVVIPEAICNDLIDNDSDGFVDCADSDCAGNPVCVVLPEAICNDLIDNDSDGFVDCADSDCAADPACLVGPEICDNGIDDDADTFIDCADSDCAAFPACILGPELICDDTIDNDLDSDIDCADLDCATDPVCLPSMFTVLAYPEKRVAKTDGNFSTRGSLNFTGIGGDDFVLSVPTGDSGFGQIENTTVPAGWYKVSFKGLSHLTKFLKNSDLSQQSIQILENTDYDFDFTLFDPLFLLAGDTALGKDDFVNSMDISASVRALYQNEEHGDLNKDGAVNALDLGILFFNLYKSGEK
ncbi:MAG: hypothetical protein RBS56_01715 [Candidatus Gracilibacteria bacterium]|jgi:hypothetical protein|nr:hypothetical protein [Candidatus Gracilibacteria bacterium]